MSDDKPPFDLSNLGDLSGMLGNLMGQVQQVQAQIQQTRQTLRGKTVEGRAGGGIVKVTANGGGEVVRIEIDPVAVDPRDIPMLEDLITAATNDALAQARTMLKDEMAQVTGGIPIPGLMDLL
jgi:hypothetical protein